MAFLLELKESFKKFYNRYNTYVVPASKFIIALICFIMINTSIGYMDKLKNPVFALLLSVICAFLPGGFTLIVLSAFILIQLYVIAPEFALLVLCVMLLMYLLYFRFAPKTAYILIITAMFCWMKIPFVLPVAIGLCSSVAAVIPVSFGVIMYYIIRTASDYEAAISDDSLSESMKQLSYLIESHLKNRHYSSCSYYYCCIYYPKTENRSFMENSYYCGKYNTVPYSGCRTDSFEIRF